jgi:hypothetical protein
VYNYSISWVTWENLGYVPDLGVDLSADHNDFEIGYSVTFIMSCAALNVLRCLDLLAAYLENPDSHRHEDANGRSFLVDKLAVCRNPSFRPA